MIQYVNMNIKYAKFVKFEIARYAHVHLEIKDKMCLDS